MTRTPQLSIIAIAHDMPCRTLDTLRNLGAAYQRGVDADEQL